MEERTPLSGAAASAYEQIQQANSDRRAKMHKMVYEEAPKGPYTDSGSNGVAQALSSDIDFPLHDDIDMAPGIQAVPKNPSNRDPEEERPPPPPPEHLESNVNSRIEHIDGVDFQRHFGQLKVSGKETASKDGANTAVYTYEVAARTGTSSKRNENSSKNQTTDSRSSKGGSLDMSWTRKMERAYKHISSLSETSTAPNAHRGVESVGKRQSSINPPNIEVCATEDLGEQLGYDMVEQLGHENKPRAFNESPTMQSQSFPEGPESDFSIHKVLAPDKNPFADIEAGQLGFVNYLFEKAYNEIKSGSADAAKPYIERLRLIDRTERVICALEDEYYGKIIVNGVTKLQNNDLSSALDILEELKAPALLKYKEILRQEIANYLHRIAVGYINRSEYKEAFQAISKLEAQLKTWEGGNGRSVSTAQSRNQGANPAAGVRVDRQPQHLRDLVGNHIKSKAITHTEAGEYPQAVALLRFLDGFSYDRERVEICRVLAWGFLKAAEAAIQKENLEFVWTNIFRTDIICNVADSWPDYLLPNHGDLVQTVFQLSEGGRSAQKLAIDSMYMVPLSGSSSRGGVLRRLGKRRVARTREIIDARTTVLQRVRMIYERRFLLELENSNLHSAFQALSDLERFWRLPEQEPRRQSLNSSTLELKIVPTANMRTVQEFLVSRQRTFDIILPEKNGRSLIDNKPMPTGADGLQTGNTLGFVYYLTRAEVSFFEKRDLEKAHFWCQKAIAIADGNIPSWASKSDALYLLARIFERKGMPLDADYYYSLIPSFEKYDQWRIYGNPAMVLRQNGHNPRLDRGKLSLSDDGILDIFDRVTQDFPHGITNSADHKSLDALIRAVYADDVFWSIGELEVSRPSSNEKVFDGPFLHVLATKSPLEYLRIALHNPWVDIEQTDQNRNTALHRAAKIWNKEKVSLLIRSGANIKASNLKGDTPLHTMLAFTPGVKLENADIPGTLSQLFADETVAIKSAAYLLNIRNSVGQNPLDVLKASLVKELEAPQSHTEIGYLKRFADAWEYISKLGGCPSAYKTDTIFNLPAQHEKKLRGAHLGGGSGTAATLNRPARSVARERIPYIPEKITPKEKETTKKKKRFGIF
ncbi:hypothetical protein TWF506_006187 [Arthrobotrys conoides]|uniref:Ankyrin repeat protein n=1 Tax=Arthrobotrys conoides TaxID=74498 RepID=A0AAN8NQI5_9PEZI